MSEADFSKTLSVLKKVGRTLDNFVDVLVPFTTYEQ